MPKAKTEQKKEARRLRIETRASIGDIAKQVGASKSTISVWLHDIPLSDEEKRQRWVEGAHFAKELAAKETLSCAACGTEFQRRSTRSRYCTGRCRDQYKYKRQRKSNPQAVVKARRKMKQRAVEYKGGKCQVCGYARSIRALKFHHLDPNEKDFTISGYSKSWDRIKRELDKCLLVCGNCHDEIHDGLVNAADYVALAIAA